MTSFDREGPVTIGAPPFPWAAPLLEGLAAQSDIRLITAPVSRLAAMLETGECAAALISPLDAASRPTLMVFPGIGVCSEGEWDGSRLEESPVRLNPEEAGLSALTLAACLAAEKDLPEGAALDPLWHALARLPFTHLVWAAGFGAPINRLRILLTQAFRAGEARGLTSAYPGLRYAFMSAEVDGVRELTRRAIALGLWPEDQELGLC